MNEKQSHLGGAKLEKVLSQGLHSLLYRAFSEELGRPVMIKILNPKFLPDSRTARRFLRGGAIARGLQHPNIVQTFASGHEQNTIYMLMEYLEGHSLDRVLKNQGRLQWRLACDIVRQVAQALEYAGSRRIIHRKVEPAHIMLSPGGRVSMLGFGLARMSDSDQDKNITAEGALVDIGAYSAPEAGTPKADHCSDIYSLGAVFYHLLGGKPPFSSADPLELLRKHRTETPWPVRDLAGKELPEDVEEIVNSMLEKDVARRIHSATELIACLDAVLRPEVVGTDAPTKEANKEKGRTLLFTTREMFALRHQKSVLIFESQTYNLTLMQESLRRLGLVAIAAHDIKTALEAAKSHPIDALIVDVRIPGGTLGEFLAQISAHKPDLPVVISRNSPTSRKLRTDDSLNIIACLERPLDPFQIRQAIQAALS